MHAPETALAIGAHPDDIEFGAGGTLASWAAAGCRVVMAVLTDGSKGTWDPGQDPELLAQVRQDEQRAAAAALGATEVVFVGRVDGELLADRELRSDVARLIRQHRPDVVLGHDPWLPYSLHPDHRNAGWAVVDGAVAARDHLFFPEHGLPHHRPERLMLWNPAEANHWEDIEATLPVKLEALLCHASQHETTMNRAGDGSQERAAFEARIRQTAAEHGAAADLEAAESFRSIPL